ncbi:MAG: hypothetical protein HOL66_06950 [Rhodospirillaceae bacterium]|jgi:hypothetical protein|nr:hypothetical protein [Rhodospirillaceae bacterium]MBT5243964.1 hypothetical protein [Rhodospirillaceae bacterium]MBT5560945.1 hypothetical protein [Rhodospirillaceae bacterium]MBT6242476.1 hypothetical protein [Rhodospirillaceae bacterium]MBT7137813.1 hypothetical protein [Rhodospirillaceae bacterium]
MSQWQTVVAIYAAIVATGALALEVRRWVEGRARVFVSVSPGMILAGNGEINEDKRYLVVTAVNRGSLPTTVTHMVLLEYKSFWHRWREKSSSAALVTNPVLSGYPQNLPRELPPGSEWKGIGNHDKSLEEWIATGKLYAGVYCTHSDRPILEKVRKATIKENVS